MTSLFTFCLISINFEVFKHSEIIRYITLKVSLGTNCAMVYQNMDSLCLKLEAEFMLDYANEAKCKQ